jgi:hypothetical protein
MRRTTSILICLLLIGLPAIVQGDGGESGQPLTRAEVAMIKGVLKDLQAALGASPQGYDALEENYDLPTAWNPHKSAGRFSPINSGVRLRYGVDTAKAQKQIEEASEQLQRKFMEASAKGDTQEIGRLTQEYQQMIANAQRQALSAQAERKEPIAIDIRINRYQIAAIDPDGVVLEKPGFIALAGKSSRNGMARVRCFFDPVALKETETLSQVNLPHPKDGLAGKTEVGNIVIDLEGPEKEIHEWVKRINISAVLKRIK